jgi:hypothetical protein
MSSFDPMAAAIDWLSFYRARAPSIVDLYADGAALECDCNGQEIIFGRAAIAEYWHQRFRDKPAGELTDLQPDGDAILVSYRVPDGIVDAVLDFDSNGKIERLRCGYNPIALRFARDRYTWDLVCPKCGSAGIASVSEDAIPDPWKMHFRVDEVSDGFCVRKFGESATETEIICVICNVAV